MKLLVVEDNEAIVKGLVYSLEVEGFEVVVKENVTATKNELLKHDYDLILLDITLPDGNGFELCSYIKKKKDVPVIFLTARDEETNVVLGLDMGADDYVVKPFRIRELISRIKNVLRRYQKGEELSNIVTIQDITIDRNKAKVWKGKEEKILTALEYKILLMLFTNPNQLITREQILERIWDIAGNFVNDNTLTVYIKRIREKLEDNPAEPNIIKTIRGMGYIVEDKK